MRAMPNIGPMEIILLLGLALLLFGAKRLPEIGRSLGSGMREFKDSVTGDRAPEHSLGASASGPGCTRTGSGRAPAQAGGHRTPCSAPSSPERENEPSDSRFRLGKRWFGGHRGPGFLGVWTTVKRHRSSSISTSFASGCSSAWARSSSAA